MSKMYRVKNRGASTVVYKIPQDGVRREFKPGQIIAVSSEELEKLTYQPGGTTILGQFLQILDLDEVQKSNLKVEPEYYMSEEDVKVLLTKPDSLDEFLDALDFAPVGVIDLIKKLSIDLPLMDMEKRLALKEKTGFDVEAALKHQMEDKEDDQKTILKQSEGRRVKPAAAAAPAGRRTATTNYKVINKEESKIQ